jgi:hypothetical protein
LQRCGASWHCDEKVSGEHLKRPDHDNRLLIGMVVTAMFPQTYYYKGPISTHLLNNGDVSAISGLIAGGVYWLLCRRATRRDVAAAGQVRAVDKEPVSPQDPA